MIYILNYLDTSFKSYYGLDRILDFSKENLSFEELMNIERNERLGVLNIPEEYRKKLIEMNYPLVFLENGKEYLSSSYKILPLPLDFFRRDAKEVALGILGKILMYSFGENILMGKILETEAYYGDKDPASRAYRGKRNYNKGMWKSGGHIFIYMVHANWMFNITTDGEEPQAVLIRSLEPIMGLKFMYERRGRKIRELCNGPGKWTRAFGIERDMNERPLNDKLRIIESPWKEFEIRRSHRIGVSNDLEEPLRFFIPSKYTSNNKVF